MQENANFGASSVEMNVKNAASAQTDLSTISAGSILVYTTIHASIEELEVGRRTDPGANADIVRRSETNYSRRETSRKQSR